MPGWYVHLEAAHDTARLLRGGTVPAGFAVDAQQATVIGEHCHTWRNYLALGSLGPDLFYLLPDFKNTQGQVIRQVVSWALDVWEVVDSEFVSGGLDARDLAGALSEGGPFAHLLRFSHTDREGEDAGGYSVTVIG